jgi:hypothetical protein
MGPNEVIFIEDTRYSKQPSDFLMKIIELLDFSENKFSDDFFCEILKTEKKIVPYCQLLGIQSGKLFWNQNQIRFLLVEKLAIMCSLTL